MFPSSSDLITWWGRITPDRVAIVDRSRDARHTYAELDAAAERWAGALATLGVKAGDRVATLTGNRVETIALFFGAVRIGAVLVPLNWRLAAPELSRVVADAAPALLVGEGRFRALGEAAVSTAAASFRWVDLDVDAPRVVSNPEPYRRRVVAADDPAMLLYTSGSTGKPKGAILPHRQIFYNALATTTGWQLGASDTAIVANPFFHTGGWHVFSTPLWSRGGTIVLFDQFEPTAFLDALAEERVTVAFGVPTQIAMMTQSSSWGRPLPSLRFLISGGAPCPQALGDRVRDAGIAFRQGYGLTECGPNCFAISDEVALRKPGAVGWPSPFLEMRLSSGIGNGESGIDEPGELLLRGPQMFGGYFRDPERTADAVDADGWLHTGDLASRDADGAYRICGRKKDMFISGGENVFPGEVEAALCECPGVGEAIVVGVPDEKWGEVGRAFVLARAGESLTTEAVMTHARQRLAGYKVPKSVILVDDLPRLGSGKADRSALKSRL
ncbi:MAG TPA: AMP-binding protein [Gemmatimonadaceae bacterium]|nr:AMP-binding protein [Gemmatimonadaceae bacterium]